MQDRDLSDQKVRINDCQSGLAHLQSKYLTTQHNIMQNDGATTSSPQINAKSRESRAFRPFHYFARPELTKRNLRDLSRTCASFLCLAQASKRSPSPSREVRVHWLSAAEADLDRECTTLPSIVKELKERELKFESQQMDKAKQGKPKADRSARSLSNGSKVKDGSLPQRLRILHSNLSCGSSFFIEFRRDLSQTLKNLKENVKSPQNSMQDRDLSDQKVRINDCQSGLAHLQSKYLTTQHNIMQNDGATTSSPQINAKSRESRAFRPFHYFARPELTKRNLRDLSRTCASFLCLAQASKRSPSPSREVRVHWLSAAEADLDRECTTLPSIVKELKERELKFESQQMDKAKQGKPKADRSARSLSNGSKVKDGSLPQRLRILHSNLSCGSSFFIEFRRDLSQTLKNLKENVKSPQNSMQDRDLSDQKVRINDCQSGLAHLQSKYLTTQHNIMQNDGATTSSPQINAKSRESRAFRPFHYFARPELTKRNLRDLSRTCASFLCLAQASKRSPSPSREVRVHWLSAAEADLDRECTTLPSIVKELKERELKFESQQMDKAKQGKPKADRSARSLSNGSKVKDGSLPQRLRILHSNLSCGSSFFIEFRRDLSQTLKNLKENVKSPQNSMQDRDLSDQKVRINDCQSGLAHLQSKYLTTQHNIIQNDGATTSSPQINAKSRESRAFRPFHYFARPELTKRNLRDLSRTCASFLCLAQASKRSPSPSREVRVHWLSAAEADLDRECTTLPSIVKELKERELKFESQQMDKAKQGKPKADRSARSLSNGSKVKDGSLPQRLRILHSNLSCGSSFFIEFRRDLSQTLKNLKENVKSPQNSMQDRDLSDQKVRINDCQSGLAHLQSKYLTTQHNIMQNDGATTSSPSNQRKIKGKSSIQTLPLFCAS